MKRARSFFKYVKNSNVLRILLTSLLLLPYLAYIAYIIRGDQGPIDYETFMKIGNSFLEGGDIYGENSYYPLPYAGIFAVFSLLPRPLSMAIWLLAPVILALAITGFQPYTLLFAPTFSHFTGGQSSIFGLLGFYGYRKNLDPTTYAGGIFLALTCLKPQLGIVPAGYAVYQWILYLKKNQRIPAQAVSFAGSLGLIFLPSFLIRPQWLIEWLYTPRPLFDRAISSAVPRLLFLVSKPEKPTYWVLWFVLTIAVVLITWKLKGESQPLDILVLVSFIINPLVHDYDLIQILPTIQGPIMPAAAVVLSIPGWWTMTTQYGNDEAWVSFILIAPGLLITYILQEKRKRDKKGKPETPN